MTNLEDTSKKVYEELFKDRKTVEVNGSSHRIRKTSKLGLRVVEVNGFTVLEDIFALVIHVSSFSKSSISSPSGPLKKAIRICIGFSLFSVASRVSTVTSAPAFLAISMAAWQS